MNPLMDIRVKESLDSRMAFSHVMTANGYINHS